MGIRRNYMLSLVVVSLLALPGVARFASAQAPAATAPVSSAPAQPQTPAAPPADGSTPPPTANPSPASAGAAASAPSVTPVGNLPALHTKGKEKKVKPPKPTPMTIERGVLTVDGWTGKADLNYQIPDFKFAYIWVPGVGTAVISHEFFKGSKLQVDAFNGNMLTVKIDEHTVQLTSERPLLPSKNKKVKTDSAYVALDTTYADPSLFPVFGYGDTSVAPFKWPGSLADLHRNPEAPPMPAGIKPKTEAVKVCQKNNDGTEANCHVVDVPMTTGKSKS